MAHLIKQTSLSLIFIRFALNKKLSREEIFELIDRFAINVRVC